MWNSVEMRQFCLIVLFAGLCHGVSKATECTARGRFPNEDAENCRGYTMCLLGGANGFTQYKLICPAGFVYSHLEHQCTNATNYQCLPNYVCNTTGTFENPQSTNCSSYVACPNSLTGLASARQVECPLDQVFSPLKGACVNNTEYKCRDIVDSTDSLTEVPPSTTAVPNNTMDFNIPVSGENGFELSSSVSVNTAVDVCCRHVVLIAVLIFLKVNN